MTFENKDGFYIRLIYDGEKESLSFDRTHCCEHDIQQFEGIFSAPLKIKNNIFKLHLLIDVSQIEIFADDGAVAMTNLYFIKKPFCRGSVSGGAASLKLIRGSVNKLVL